MKTKIADWVYNFWYKNHTHDWIPFTPDWREKCSKCNQLKQRVSKY